ncbi:uncharacterized protein BT62DRAFT_1050827 [Guyanagaster necrorhizus]|uniref:Uncharacterized protein n=1 Tax=Guyanagaster necrorhizus TaxID=856835 RepID=A0A9P7VG43_9AGAR|nr:uncharacterized protein BT62DRAFT_1050827 [Guyanagaster necrorhizus MCA 3950]KAG7440323.1 hypothetical protein BT62DRAFT_1050827 [Guyanagaster necrorhizus MCA 3950]
MSQSLNTSKNFWININQEKEYYTVINSGQYNELLSPPQQNHVEGILADGKSPGGLGAAIVKGGNNGGQQVEMKGYGYMMLGRSKVLEDTLFCIGSNSKVHWSTNSEQLFSVLVTGLLIFNKILAPRVFWNTRTTDINLKQELRVPVMSARSTIVDLMSH